MDTRHNNTATYDINQYHPRNGAAQWRNIPDAKKLALLQHYCKKSLGIPITVKKKFLSTLCTECIEEGHTSTLQYLLYNFPTDIEYKNFLHLAIQHTKKNCLQLLLRFYTNRYLHEKDQDGRTPLQLAFQLISKSNDYIHIITLLLDAGANLETDNLDEKNNPLFITLHNTQLLSHLIQYKNLPITTLKKHLTELAKKDNKPDKNIEANRKLLNALLLTEKAYAAATEEKTIDYAFIYGYNKPVINHYFQQDAKEREEKHFHNQPRQAVGNRPPGKAFKDQFFNLLYKLSEYTKHKNKDSIALFQDNIFDTSYSGNQNALYFEIIKYNLEKIYALLHNKNLPISYKKEQYNYLCSELDICSPGIHDLISTVYRNLHEQSHINMTNWLAAFRNQLIGSLALALHNKKFPKSNNEEDNEKRQGHEKHTAHALNKFATEKGWNPSQDSKTNNDTFANDVKITPDEYISFLKELDTLYNISTISDFIQDKLQRLIDAKITAESIIKDEDHWIVIESSFYKWLTNIAHCLFGEKIDLYKLFDFDSMRGDPAQACMRAKINSHYLHQQVIQYMVDHKLIFEDVLQKNSVAFDLENSFLLDHYFPAPIDPNNDINRVNHWTCLPDADLANLLRYWKSHTNFSNHTNKNHYTKFLKALLKHAQITRKTQSLEFMVEHILEKYQMTLLINETKPVKIKNAYFLLQYYFPLFISTHDDNYESSIELNENWKKLSDEDMVTLFEHINADYIKSEEKLSVDFVMTLSAFAVRTNKHKTFATILRLRPDVPHFIDHNPLPTINELTNATEEGSIDIIQYIFNIKPYLRGHIPRLITIASDYNKPETLAYLLGQTEAENAFNINTTDIYPLHTATDIGSPLCLELLLKKIKVTYKGDEKLQSLHINNVIRDEKHPYDNLTAMQVAALDNTIANPQDKYACILLLDKAGADIPDELIRQVIDRKNYTLLKTLLTCKGAKVSVAMLIDAIKSDNNNLLKILLTCKSKEIDAKYPASGNKRPLDIALRNNNEKALDLLILAKANLTSPEKKHPSLLAYTILSDQEECLRIVLKHRINLNERVMFQNKTALEYAIGSNSPRLLKIIMTGRPDLMIPDFQGDLPIHVIVKQDPKHFENEKMLAYLLKHPDHKRCLNEKNTEGDTAVHLAIYKKNNLLLAMLVYAGANLNIPNKQGKTPLYYAILNNDIRALTHLFKKISHLDLSTPENKKAFTLAHTQNNSCILDFLHRRSFLTNLAFTKLPGGKVTLEIGKHLLKIREIIIINIASSFRKNMENNIINFATAMNWLDESIHTNTYIDADNLATKSFFCIYTHKYILEYFEYHFNTKIQFHRNHTNSDSIDNFFKTFFGISSIDKMQLINPDHSLNMSYLYQQFIGSLINMGVFTESVRKDVFYLDKPIFLSAYFPIDAHQKRWEKCPASLKKFLLDKKLETIAEKINTDAKATSNPSITFFSTAANTQSASIDNKELISSQKKFLREAFLGAININQIDLIKLLLEKYTIETDIITEAIHAISKKITAEKNIIILIDMNKILMTEVQKRFQPVVTTSMCHPGCHFPYI